MTKVEAPIRMTVAASACVAVVAKEEATQRAHEEPDAEDAETQEQRAIRDVRGKEQRADGRGKVGVDREVVPLDDVADRARDDGQHGGRALCPPVQRRSLSARAA